MGTYFIFFFIGSFFVFAIICMFIAQEKKRDKTSWFILGFVLGLIALIALPKLDNETEKDIFTCGECSATVEKDDKICPNCGEVFEGDILTCIECGATVKEDDKFCPNCGDVFEKDIFTCIECRATVEEDDKFCPNCGYVFEDKATT